MPPNKFEEDFKTFQRATNLINAVMPVEEIAPANTIKITNTQRLPFSASLFWHPALQRKQYEMHLVGSAVAANNTPLTDHLGVYSNPRDQQTLRVLHDTIYSHPYAKLLFDIAGKAIHHYCFLQTHLQFEMQNAKHAAIGGVDSEWYRRAFMTSSLISELYFYPSNPTPIDYQLYNKFHAEDNRPFSYEELFGIAETMVADVFQQNPDIPPAYAAGEGS